MSDLKNCVTYTAGVISSGRPTNRRFDGCFEWYGSTAVAIALYRRTLAKPNTKLAQNIWKYISEEITKREAEEYTDWNDLEALLEHLNP
ncbi:hypothetical protein N9Y00_07085 [Tateyamaria sp.]|nr:hypothetical protein [Tateyamaria sp.]